VSGGLDSCVAAACIIEWGYAPAFLHVCYGQRTQERELKAFHDIADYYSVRERLVCNVGHLIQIGGSALTDPAISVPDGDLSRREIPRTYVPFRNANLLSVAVSWAEVLGAGTICIGAVEEDSSGYPDCRREFFEAFESAIEKGTRPETRIRILTPLIELNKAKIVERGIRLHAPLELTWSCYRNATFACGKCDSCRLRLRGFEKAGQIDPIPYSGGEASAEEKE